MLLFGLLVAAVLWVMLAAVHSLRLAPSGVSAAELERRHKAGDKKAKRMRERDVALPDVLALRFAAQTALIVLFVTAGLAMLGYIYLPLLILALLFIGAGANFELIANKAQQLFEKHETEIITFTERWSKFLKHFRQEDTTVPPALGHSKEELIEKIATMRGIVSKDELALIKSGLELSEKSVSEVMTPLESIDGLEQEEALGPVTLDQLHHSGHTRFPVYNQDLNHIVGMLYLRDVANVQHSHKYVRDAMRTNVGYIREDYDLEHALAIFIQAQQSLLVVVDRSAKTVGLLGLEDVLTAYIGRNVANDFEYHEGAKAVAHAKIAKD